jgi:hypothetical protein
VVDPLSERRVKQSCPIYHFGARAPPRDLAQKAREQNVTLKHFSVLPALLDDVCDAVNFYGSGKNGDADGGSTSASGGVESGVGAKVVITSGGGKAGKSPASRVL